MERGARARAYDHWPIWRVRGRGFTAREILNHDRDTNGTLARFRIFQAIAAADVSTGVGGFALALVGHRHDLEAARQLLKHSPAMWVIEPMPADP